MTLFSETYAQHMDLEGGNYDCFDEVKGWFKSPIPCDGVIITPDEDYVECPWCYQEFSTSCHLANEPKGEGGVYHLRRRTHS